MIRRFQVLSATLLTLSVLAAGSGSAAAQPGDDQSCAATLTEQLRRFSEKCLSDLVGFVASEPKMSAKIYSEKDRYYLILSRTEGGLLAEAVGKFNYPLMKPETPENLKRLGWAPPENEADNWKIRINDDGIKDAGRRLSEALQAYGLAAGEALSLTVGPALSDKPTKG